MIFSTPELLEDELLVLGLIQEQRDRLRLFVNSNPRKWTGLLRRNTLARAIQGSNSIEGYHASVEDVVAAIENEEPIDATHETWLAIKGYRDALTYILRISQDPDFEYQSQLLKSLHFMMINYDLTKNPGQWRPGYIAVVNEGTGEKVYEGPDAKLVPGLIDELVNYLRKNQTHSNLVQAAMAHLNLTMIHPFSDGNGRMARALQTLVLAREGIAAPEFSSIEEYLGRNTQAYYDVLAKVGQGEWNPDKSARPWIRFCLKAHYQQAETLIKRNNELGQIWNEIIKIIKNYKLNDRCEIALVNAVYGYRTLKTRYQVDAEVSEYVAGRDLRKLADLGLLVPKGEKRGRYYIAGEPLREIRKMVKEKVKGKAEDPFDLIKKGQEPNLPGLQR